MKLPSQKMLRTWLDYNPATGVFVWIKEPKKVGSLLGKEAGTTTSRQYKMIQLPGFVAIGAHRLAWCYVNGFYIDGLEVDHRDGDPANNAIANLRLATSTEQKQNKCVQSNNRSGLKGAYYHACHKGKKWRSQIKIDENGVKRLIFLGYFHTALEAHLAYAEAAREHFGEFARVA